MYIEVGKKVYVIDVNNNINEFTIEKITRSLITLSDGKIFCNQSAWIYECQIECYHSKLDGFTMVDSKINADRYIKYYKLNNFNVNGYRNIKYPTQPSTPRMSSTTPTKEEIIRYQTAMEEFERQMKIYREDTECANIKMKEWMDTYREFLSYRDGLDMYSDEIRSAVYIMAYDAGHSCGYGEVANYHSTFAEFAVKVIELSKNNKEL